jgi:BASS family bile acid:Na+ symporter
MLLPLVIGIAIRGRSEPWAFRLRPVFAAMSNVSMIVAVVLLIGLNFAAMIATFGSGAAAVAALFVLVLVAGGYALGGPSPTTRSVLGLGVGQRNIAAALIVATQNAMGPQVVVMLLISTLVGLVVLLPAAVWFARHPSPASASVMGVFFDPIRKEVVR